jgi:hypothetical protein
MAATTNKKSTTTVAPSLLAKSDRKQTDTAKATGATSVSKQANVLAMLQTPAGATIAGMVNATGWKKHSVRGFLAGVVRKRLKLKLTSETVTGNRVYRVAAVDKSKSQRRRSKTQKH